MSRPRLIDEVGPARMPCAAHPRAGDGQRVHPEGACACFHGGPAPVQAPDPERAILANRPGVFDTSWIGQPANGPKRHRGAQNRVRAWLVRLAGR